MIGTTLIERYRLEDELGRGGMGVVYHAFDSLLEREVAVKLLSGEGLGSEGRARLLHEARAAARLNHPNIVTVHDAGETDGSPFIVMELVEGLPLNDRRPQGITETMSIARQICTALHHAHEHGVIHRDLKPENILVTGDGTAKLMDFGLARSVASRLTQEGTLVGTVFYLAPELALGQEYDGRADLYALGVMLYELTTGELPFFADDPLAIITQHLHAPVVPPRAKKTEIPPSLDALIVQLMAKAPDQRPATAGDVNQRLVLLEMGSEETAEAPPAVSLLDRIVRGRLIGRERELTEARTLWKRSLSQEGQFLLISGEPGIGKTRLVREIVTQAEVSGGRSLLGECYPEGGIPYGPFGQIVRRSLVDSGGYNLQLPDFVLADLFNLAPALRLQFPDVPPNPPLDPESEQHRLYENVVTFCAAISEWTPHLLVFEDVHWGDSGTLAMLRHLARRTRRQRLMIVATYREVELDQSRPFQNMLVDLNRERLATRLKLTRLDRTGTEALLRALFAEEITPEFLEGVYRETEGNPFFIEEVVKALIEEGRLYYEDGRWVRPPMNELQIPQSVRVAIQARIGKLLSAVQETLTLAAIIGREFDFDTLAAAGEMSEDTLVEALETAERAQLVEEVSGLRGGTFRFIHALIHTTLVESMSGLRRRRLHSRVAASIELLRPHDLVALALHYVESGDMEKGLTFSLQAGHNARQLFARDEALYHYGRAREIAETLHQTDQLLHIDEAIGDIQTGNDATAAVQAYQRALELAPDDEERARLQVKIGATYLETGDERGIPFLEAAMQALNPHTQGNQLARATASVGRFHHYRGRHRQAITYLERARELAEPLEDAFSLTPIYAYLAGAFQHLADFNKSMAWARRLLDLGQRKNSPLALAAGYEFLAEDYFAMGAWRDALENAQLDHKTGKETGILARVAWAQFALMNTRYGLGELEAAQAHGKEALELAEATGDLRLAVITRAQMAITLCDLGEADDAELTACEAADRGDQMEQVYMVATGRDALAYWFLYQGDADRARETLEPAVALIDQTDSRLVPLLIFPRYAESCVLTGDLDEANHRLIRALEIARTAPSQHIEGVSLRILAMSQAEEGELKSAGQTLEQAGAIFERLGSRLELAKCLRNRSLLAARRGDPQAAREHLSLALTFFQECGAQRWVDEANAALKGNEGLF